jgi:hypothetical protein
MPALHAHLLLRAAAALALIHAGTAQAAEFVVDSATDAGEGSLRQAILDANASAGPHSIVVRVPTSNVTLSLESALPPITASEVRVSASESPGFSVDGMDAHRIFEAAGSSTRLELADLRLIRGRAAQGGCVRGRDNLGFSLLLERVQFENCRAQGGMDAAAGGAVFVTGGVLEVLDSRFVGNSVGNGGRGGAVFADVSTLDLRESRFIGNLVEGGSLRSGGAFALRSSRLDTAFISAARFSQNSAAGGNGGALALGCADCSVRVERSWFGQNSADAGAALDAAQDFPPGAGVLLTIENTTFERNLASTSGAALRLATTTLDLRSTSFQRNRAASGAHLATLTPFELSRLSNTIFAAVDAAGGAACLLGGVPTTPGPRGGNLFADGSCGVLAASGGTSIAATLLGTLNTAADALPVLIFPEASAPIDAGGQVLACPTEDARGTERPIDSDGDGNADCDIGAFEHPQGSLIFRDGFES